MYHPSREPDPVVLGGYMLRHCELNISAPAGSNRMNERRVRRIALLRLTIGKDVANDPELTQQDESRPSVAQHGQHGQQHLLV